MTKLSTKDLNDRVSKVLQPGNHTCKVVSVKLESVSYKEGAYHVNLYVEGPDLGKDFEGFWYDKDDESKGRYKGQAGRVRANEYPYSDGETKTGIKVSRDKEIMRFIKNFCSAMGTMSWFDEQDNKHETIESFVEGFNTDKPFKDVFMRMCLGGREYQNLQGYTNYDLFFPKGTRSRFAYESEKIPEAMSKVLKFNPEIHIKKKKAAPTVDNFEKPVTKQTKDQFSL